MIWHCLAISILVAIVGAQVTTPTVVGTGTTGNATNEQSDTRREKALSVFQVVRFPNIGCTGSSSYNGTCYTASECLNKGGTNAGSCASGFGVCCTFLLGCGSTIAENCSYFQSATTQSGGACSVQICECSTDICQLRLDFNTFVITGPSTLTYTQVFTVNGAQAPVVAFAATVISSNFATQCLTDTFSVTGNSAGPPVICGTNTGYHMYVDSSPSCNTLSFQLGPTGIGVPTLAATSKSWNIKISQISCYSQWLAPQGCTQYYTGTSGQVTSYNYAGGVQLANQQQEICFRRERGYCRLCITPSTAAITTDFALTTKSAMGLGTPTCCGYGVDGLQTLGFDCLMVPGAQQPGGIHAPNQFCGAFLNNAASGAAAAAGTTVCTTQTPFNINFLTDAYTVATAIVPVKLGFRLTWFLTTC